MMQMGGSCCRFRGFSVSKKVLNAKKEKRRKKKKGFFLLDALSVHASIHSFFYLFIYQQNQQL